MSTHESLSPPGPRISALGRWTRRVVPLAFAAVVVTAGLLALHRPAHRAAGRPSRVRVAHGYPADPVVPERPKVRGPSPKAPSSSTISGPVVMRSFAALSRRLPPGVLHRTARAWVLERPAAVAGAAVLSLRGGALELAPGSFLLATKGGTVRLTGVRVSAVDRERRLMTRPEADRGFLAATSHGKLVLHRDRLVDLGHLGVQAYGVSMQEPAPGSEVVRCSIDGNYFGVYLTHAVGVRIVGNTVSRSVIYGIDPHTESTRVIIRGNRVVDSGVHAIILATRVTDTVIEDNFVEGSRLHGIVIYDHSDRNRVEDNRILGTFDGIVVTDSSSNQIRANSVTRIHRFGLRITGASTGNVAARNVFGGALLAVYVYGGATRNTIVQDVFHGDHANVRVRSDAPGNLIRPVPPRSELGR